MVVEILKEIREPAPTTLFHQIQILDSKALRNLVSKIFLEVIPTIKMMSTISKNNSKNLIIKTIISKIIDSSRTRRLNNFDINLEQ